MINMKRYELERIINLANMAFDDVSLDAFCLSYFAEVFDKFTAGMSKDRKIILLLDHCRRNNMFGELLSHIRNTNEGLYKQFGPYLKKARIFISYKRDIEPDELVALEIHKALAQECHIFIDQTMLPGTRWAERIETELRRSDFLISLLSNQSVYSEMVLAEIRTAHHLTKSQGHPTILPVRLDYRDHFQYPLSEYLNPLHWAFWRDHSDTPRIIEEIKQAIAGGSLPIDDRLKRHVIQTRHPEYISPPTTGAQPIPTKIRVDIKIRLEKPEGTMSPQSALYVERQEDRVAIEAIKEQGVTLTIKAPRQMGKSSLLMRVIETALRQEKRVVFLDFQLFDQSALTNADTFFRQFCTWLTEELDLDDHVDDYWQHPQSNSQRCTRYVTDLLKKLDTPLVLAMDEVDNVFDAPFRSDFFGMLRNWHNNRAHPTKLFWRNLDLALVTSTEPYQLIENLNQSPFNVGEIIDLPDFTPEQVAELNQRHNSPFTPAQLQQLMQLLGGHPYLTRRAMYLVASGRFTAAELFAQSITDRGPFGDHLRHHAFRLHDRPELIRGLRQVIMNNACPDERIFFRLRGAGLVHRPAGGPVAFPRCKLYADFFQERLNG